MRVADSAAADSIPGLAERLLADAPKRFALAALSMGGYVAFEVLRRAPERVERLALVDTTPKADRPEQTERRRMLVALAKAEGIRAVLPHLIPGFLAPHHRDDPALVEIITGMAEEVGVGGFTRQQHAILGRVDSTPDLARIGCPAAVIVGEHDQLTPPAGAAEMAAAIRGATLTVIPDAGHLSPLENGAAVAAAMRAWLAQP